MTDNKEHTSTEALLAALSSFSSMVELVMSAQQHSLANVDDFRDELKCLREKIGKLNKVLHEGNGKEPVMLRLAWLEEKVKEMLATQDQAKAALAADAERAKELVLEEAKVARQLVLEDRKGKWGIWTKLLTGLFGIAALVIPLLTQC